jgi:hypothetical protein
MICKRGTTGTRAYFTATNTTLAVGIHGENGIDLDCANTLGGNQVWCMIDTCIFQLLDNLTIVTFNQ